MFTKILVATDSSPMAEQIFDRALFLAKATQANMKLLHVLSAEENESPDLPQYVGLDYYFTMTETSWRNYREQWDAFKEERLQWLHTHAETARASGLSVEVEQACGSPGRIICQVAKTWGADLIVMGRRGRSGLSELLLGSVSNYVLHHAPCSVLALQALASSSHSAYSVDAVAS